MPMTRAQAEAALPQAPLYTKYIPKRGEYRIHVFNGQVIDAQQKLRRRGTTGDGIVRNTDNGFIFARRGIAVPAVVNTQAVLGCQALGLTFGGVDVVFNERRGAAYVLEINTAPGLEGSTVETYKRAIQGYISN